METYWVSRKDFLVPRCVSACPAGVDVPRYIRAVRDGRYDDAVAVLRERLPLPTVCADACFAPCEDVCAYKQYGDPIAIRALKRAAMDHGNDSWLKKKKNKAATGKKIAVIGGGPAGLTAAYYLTTNGHAVTIYDAWPEPGGTMRYGVPEFRLPAVHLDRDIQVILDLGVEFKGRTLVGRDLSFQEIKNSHDGVIVACGAMANLKTSIEGADQVRTLKGWDFLKDISSGQSFNLGRKVVVIGGGNVALDAARTALRLGAKNVTLIYRRTKEEMPAHPDEVTAAETEGVVIWENWSPCGVSSGGQTSSLNLVKCMSEGQGGRECRLVYDDGITHRIDADTIVLAIGQQADLSFLAGQPDMLAGPASLKTDPVTLKSGANNVFACGDVVTGPASIVGAVAQGRQAAESLDKYLGGTGDFTESLAPSEDRVEIKPLPLPIIPRQHMSVLESWERLLGFEQTEKGLTDKQIRIEAGRCLSCDARKFDVILNTENCKECGYCASVCSVDAFGPADFFNAKGYRPMVCKSSDWCVGCGQCFFICPDFAIDIREAAAGGQGRS